MRTACIAMSLTAIILFQASPEPKVTVSGGQTELESHVFRSVDKSGEPDEAGQDHAFEISADVLRAGENCLQLEWAGTKKYAGEWIVWNYLSFRKAPECSEDDKLWYIGTYETTYGVESFSEFNGSPSAADCPALGEGHRVGKDGPEKWPKDLNDGKRNRVRILFNLGQPSGKYCLFVSTRYASHDNVEGFPMRLVVCK